MKELLLPLTETELRKVKSVASKWALDFEMEKWSHRKSGQKYHIKETRTAAVSDIKDPVYEREVQRTTYHQQRQA